MVPVPRFDKAETRFNLKRFVDEHSQLYHDDIKIDFYHKVVIVPNELEFELSTLLRSFRMKISNSGNAALGCIMMCDNPDRPTLTDYPVTVFHDDLSTETRHMCRSCMVESLKSIVGTYFDEGEYDIEALSELRSKLPMIPTISCDDSSAAQPWAIPLGSLLMSLCMDGVEMSRLVEAWVKGVYQQAFHTSPDVVTFCPEHPEHLIYLDETVNEAISCQKLDCYLMYCPKCKAWHQGDQGCISHEDKKCPKCKAITQKSGGCNHIACVCGCHWCYECQAGFTMADECYLHMTDRHGGFGI
jgi:hypothetical protein